MEDSWRLQLQQREEESLRREYGKAMQDPAYVSCMANVERDFAPLDAETLREIPFRQLNGA